MTTNYPYTAVDYISEDLKPDQLSIKLEQILRTENRHYCDEFEYYLITSGEGTVEINGETLELTSAMLVQFMPFHVHRFIMNKNQKMTAFHIKLPLGMLLNTTQNQTTYLRSLKNLNKTLPLVKLNKKSFQRTKFMLETVLDEYQTSQSDKESLNVSLIAYISYVYQQDLDLNQNFSKNLTWECLQYIQFHHQEKISADIVAEHLGISATEVKAMIKKETDCSFSQFLNQVRIRNAVALLQFEDLSVNQIGRICGYQADAYFYKVFREIKGQTPAEYRNDLTEQQLVSTDSWEIIAYIFEHFNQNISIEQLSNKLSISKPTINKILQNSLGLNYKQFLNQTRVQIGKNLLNNFDIPVNQIAEMVGFNDSNAFHRNLIRYN